MILIQSYSSPKEMSLDRKMYDVLKTRIHNLKLLFKKTEKDKVLSTKEFLPLSIKSNFIKDKDNLIVGWGADACLYAWLIGRLTFRRKKYLSQNLIVRELTGGGIRGLIGRFRFILYKRALHSKNFYVTVNSAALIPHYSKMFGCDSSRFFVVYDHMTLSERDIIEKRQREKSPNSPYVFCGGKAARDVDSFTKIVKSMPDISFKCVFPESFITDEMRHLSNLECYSNLPREEFNSILNGAQICCIPLKSKAPCGLIVMQHAVLMGIPIVSTDTPSMREVIPDDSCGFLHEMGDVESMVDSIKRLIESPELRRGISDNALKNAEKFSPEAVGNTLADIAIGLLANNVKYF